MSTSRPSSTGGASRAGVGSASDRSARVDLRLDGINDSRAAALAAAVRRIEDHRGAADAAQGATALDAPSPSKLDIEKEAARKAKKDRFAAGV